MSRPNTLSQALESEIWKLTCLAAIGKNAAFNEVAEAALLAHLFEVMEERLNAILENSDTFFHVQGGAA